MDPMKIMMKFCWMKLSWNWGSLIQVLF